MYDKPMTSPILLCALILLATPSFAEPPIALEAIAEMPVPDACGLNRSGCRNSQTNSHFMTDGDWIGLWDLRTGQQVARMDAHDGDAQNFVFTRYRQHLDEAVRFAVGNGAV